MGIENIKRWQWMLIGALIGLAFAYTWTSNVGEIEEVTGSDLATFERDVQFQEPRSGKPLVSDIIIQPPTQSFQGPVNVVTYKRLAHDRQGQFWYLDKHLVARIPFKPIDPRLASSDPNFTIETFLSELAKQNNFVKYHYAWWLEPKDALLIGAAVGVVVIGILWPTLLNLLVTGGLASKREPKSAKDKSSLWYTKSSSTSPQQTKPKVSAEDEQRLRDLTEAYDRLTPASAPPPDQQQPAVVQPVSKLEGGPLAKAAEIKKEEDDIEVKGEYYPVLIHHKKQADAKKE
jgi:hypothetical protein